jgi:hypothetical protein
VIEGQLAAKEAVLKPATRKETTTIFIIISSLLPPLIFYNLLFNFNFKLKYS